jgi:(4S)-4-hydroxy-5-phosphonooxypentane-2,3-dione isomerase
MLIVQVHVLVKENYIKDFIETTKENAKSSILEPGIVRFDIIQQIDEPNNFILYEIYRTAQDTAKHKNTEHYRVWRDKVQNMMAEPRRSVKYQNIFPDLE